MDNTQRRNYAKAVSSSATSKSAAYITHINPHVKNPSAAAWRLERTQSMRKVLAEVKEELAIELEEAKRIKNISRLNLLSIEQLLSNKEELTNSELIAVLKLANKTVSKDTSKHETDSPQLVESPSDKPKYDMTGIIV